MFRYGLVSYLLFVVAAGPCFCCCTVNRLADQIASRFMSGEHQKRSGGCCHCYQRSLDDAPAEKSSKQPRPPKPKKCPCQQQRADYLGCDGSSVDNTKLAKAGLAILFDLVVADALCVHFLTIAPVTSNSANDSPPFRDCTIARLLSALQILRC